MLGYDAIQINSLTVKISRASNPTYLLPKATDKAIAAMTKGAISEAKR
ncbi:hypothetical protein [Rivularia sp. UHCC 0363]|nr:hypothetical protein [Rivularia sp. UHCC 0363]MEA5596343.1 hypothetical protein [Rivularia sp. UHCC 0363]